MISRVVVASFGMGRKGFCLLVAETMAPSINPFSRAHVSMVVTAPPSCAALAIFWSVVWASASRRWTPKGSLGFLVLPKTSFSIFA